MIVSEPMLPLSNGGWSWPAGQTAAAEDRPRSTNPEIPGEVDDGLPVALVAPPPLIPRIYPGL